MALHWDAAELKLVQLSFLMPEDKRVLRLCMSKSLATADHCWKSLLTDRYPADPFTYDEMQKKLTLQRFQMEVCVCVCMCVCVCVCVCCIWMGVFLYSVCVFDSVCVCVWCCVWISVLMFWGSVHVFLYVCVWIEDGEKTKEMECWDRTTGSGPAVFAYKTFFYLPVRPPPLSPSSSFLPWICVRSLSRILVLTSAVPQCQETTKMVDHSFRHSWLVWTASRFFSLNFTFGNAGLFMFVCVCLCG